MAHKDLNKFFISIVFPSILAVSLFIISIFTIILPAFEYNMMERKKEMISELTNTAWSLLEEYHLENIADSMDLNEAQATAAKRIEKIRYGNEHKDYFWIIDMHPTMVMHPYRNELQHIDLTNYADPNGKKLFVEATKIAQSSNEGFIDYMWQWKDDSTRIVPKLSYVKKFGPWNWIVGTGIYLEDVQEEIKQLKARLLKISGLITFIIIVIVLFVIRQSLNIENKRKVAESDLILSQQKYKSLVEASTEGTLMIVGNRIIFANIKFAKLVGFDTNTVMQMSFEELYSIKWQHVLSLFGNPKKSVNLETQLKCHDKTEKGVVLSISRIQQNNTNGYVIITKEISPLQQLEKETEQLSDELQTSLLMMNQPLKSFIKPAIKCPYDSSVGEVAQIMNRKSCDVVFLQKDDDIVGVINYSDLSKRALSQAKGHKASAIEVMTSPVIGISETALLYEAILLLNSKNVSHLLTRNDECAITGVIGYKDVYKMQQNSVSFLIKEIAIAEDIESLQKIHQRLPALVNALIESGDKTKNITRIITSVTDTLTKRILTLAIEDLGTPPCDFAFMVMGSEGRKEQTLSTDQDNAIVFEDLLEDKLEDAYKYFRDLGKIVCNNLHLVGYRLCKGEVMANNPKWAQPLSVWQGNFSSWIINGDPQSLLEASIFFDFRSVFGKHSLVNTLAEHVIKTLDGKSAFYYHLAQSILKFKPPLSMFGNIKGEGSTSEQAEVDIKKLLMPIVGFSRIYSLKHGLSATNSLDRIKQLYAKEVIAKSLYNELELSYNYLMQLRFKGQTKSIMHNEQPNNMLNLNSLTHIEIATLKKIFSEISNLQTKLNFDFKGGL